MEKDVMKNESSSGDSSVISFLKKRKEDLTIVYVVLSGLFIISFLYFLLYGNGLFFYQENRSLFIFSIEYLSGFASKPGGLLEYAGNFLMQGYFCTFYGAFIVSLMIFMSGVILYKTIRSLSTFNSIPLLSLFLPLLLLLLNQADPDQYIHLMAGLLATLLYFFLTIKHYIGTGRFLYPALYPLFYYLTGSFALIYTGLIIISSLTGKKRTERLLLPVMHLTVFIITFIVFKEIIFFQPSVLLLAYPLATRGELNFAMLPLFLITCIVLLPALVRLEERMTGLIQTEFPVRVTAIIISLFVVIINISHNREFNILMKIEKAFFEQKWDNVIEIQEKYRIKNLFAQYYYNLSLSEKGLLCDRMFHGPQDFGTRALALPREKSFLNRSAYFYYTIGLIKEARHLSVETIVTWGYNPESLKMLVRSELITGNYRIAEKYLNILRKTLHYRCWAKKYSGMLYNNELIKSDPELGRKMALCPSGDFFVSRYDVRNLNMILFFNPENKKAFEYRIAFMLLEKDIKGVVHQVKKMKNMHYTTMPVHIGEAIVMFKISDTEIPYLGDLSPDPETEFRFRQYGKVFAQNINIKSARDNEITRKLMNTFWYYCQFK